MDENKEMNLQDIIKIDAQMSKIKSDREKLQRAATICFAWMSMCTIWLIKDQFANILDRIVDTI